MGNICLAVFLVNGQMCTKCSLNTSKACCHRVGRNTSLFESILGVARWEKFKPCLLSYLLKPSQSLHEVGVTDVCFEKVKKIVWWSLNPISQGVSDAVRWSNKHLIWSILKAQRRIKDEEKPNIPKTVRTVWSMELAMKDNLKNL